MAIIIKKVKTNDAMSTFEIRIKDRESGLNWTATIKANGVREALEKCKQEVRMGWANLYIFSVHRRNADGSTVSYPHLYGFLDKVILEAKNKAYDSAIKDSLIHDEDLAGYIKKLAYTDGLTTDEIFKRLYKEQPNVSAKEVQAAMFYATKNNYAQAEIKKYGFKDASKWGVINAKISEWDPTTIIKRMKETRNGDMHTNLIDKKGNVHTVFLSAWGTIDNAKVFVDVVVETPDGKQSRTFQKTANSWDEALKIMQDYKRQHINDSAINDKTKVMEYKGFTIETTDNIQHSGHDRGAAAIFERNKKKFMIIKYSSDGRCGWFLGDTYDTIQECKKEIDEYVRLHPNDSKPQLLDAAKAQQLVDLLKKAKAVKSIKDTKVKDKSFVEEIITLGREANNIKWNTSDEVKAKKFIVDATNSYKYIEQSFMSFMDEVNKNTNENGKWKNPDAKIVALWNGFSSGINTVKDAIYRIVDTLDTMTENARLADTTCRQAAILYKKYKDIYDRMYKALKK